MWRLSDADVERRVFCASVVGVFISGCMGRGDSSKESPTAEPASSTQKWRFGVQPTAESAEEQQSAEIISYSELSPDEQAFLDKLLPEAQTTCESRESVRESLLDSLPRGENVYLEHDDELFALYLQRDDEVFISSADIQDMDYVEC